MSSKSVKCQCRAKYVQKRLAELFPVVEPALKADTDFTFLVEVVLSARCTDAKVNQIAPKLFAVADTPAKMAVMEVEKVREIIKPCGLSPAKSKAIVELSKILIEKYDGKVPCSFEALEALPGVGHKTASVVMTQRFGVPAFPVDTHVFRVGRSFGLTKGNTVAKVESDLKELFPKNSWHDVHLQMVYYGRQYCKARGCDGKRCILCLEMNAQPDCCCVS
jgi:endonuclease III